MSEKIERITTPLVMAPFISHWNLIGEMQEEVTKEIALDIRAWLPATTSIRPDMMELQADPTWKEINEKTDTTTALAYGQRFYPIHFIKDESDPQGVRQYAEPDLLALAEQKPVVLAFKWPVLAEFVLLSLSEFPPPLIGHIAAIGGTKTARFMEITQLPEKAQQLQKRLHDRLSDLTEGKWAVISDHMRLWINGGLEEAQRRLQTEKRIDHRELLKAGITKMEEARDDWNTAMAAYQNRIEQPNYHDTWNEIRAMMQQLADAYAEANRIHSQPVKPPHVPDAVKHRDKSGKGMLFSPLNFPLRGALLATQAPQTWADANSARPYHTLMGGQGIHRSDYIQTSLVAPKNANLAPGQIAQGIGKILERLGALEGDIILASMAQAMIRPDPDGSIWITPETILAYRGIQPNMKPDGQGERPAGTQTKARDEVIAAFNRVMYLFVKVNQTVGKSKRPIQTQSHLLLELERKVQPPLFPGGKEHLIAWRVKPGTWFNEYGLEMDHKHFGWLMQQVLAYNPKKQAWEKYLGRYFTFYLNIAAQAGQMSIDYKVRTLLDGCGLQPEMRNPQRSQDHFKRAMDRLMADGVISDWEYRDTTDKDRTIPAPLAAKGWLNDWLDMSVLVSVASRIAAHGLGEMVERINAAQAANVPTLGDVPTITKRGRPRKSPIPHISKRPRGRPRKD